MHRNSEKRGNGGSVRKYRQLYIGGKEITVESEPVSYEHIEETYQNLALACRRVVAVAACSQYFCSV